MEFERCPRCGQLMFSGVNCRCQRFLYWFHENEVGDIDLAGVVYAMSSADACERAVYACADSDWVPSDVFVHGGGCAEHYTVSLTVQFHAHLVTV